MKTLTLEFHNEDEGSQINMTIGAGDTELNEYFRAATLHYVQPHALAINLGRVSEEKQREIMMQAYACGVVLSTEPQMSEEEVLEWFKRHPKEFDILFEIADLRKNFEDNGNPDELQHAGTSAGPSDEGSG